MNKPPTLLVLGILAVGALAVASFTASTRVADAGGSDTCTAHFGGIESGKKLAAELVVLNLTVAPITFDLVLRDADGTVLVNRAAEVTVAPRATATVDIPEQLSRDLPRKTKPYAGLLAVELTADAPFGPESAIVHVTQYIGKRAKPKAAFVLRPLYTGVDDE